MEIYGPKNNFEQVRKNSDYGHAVYNFPQNGGAVVQLVIVAPPKMVKQWNQNL